MNHRIRMLFFKNTPHSLFLLLLLASMLMPAIASSDTLSPAPLLCKPAPPPITLKKTNSTKDKKRIKKVKKIQVEDHSVFYKDVAEFSQYMAEKYNFDQANLDCIFAQIKPNKTVLRLIMPAPPGKPKNWRAYQNRVVEPNRIAAGTQFWDEHQDALASAEALYGVPADIIIGVIGVETIYGKNTGNFRVLDALATLAFQYPELPNKATRMAFFRDELENALLLAHESNIAPLSLYGSYAGAIGWPQFMPSSIRKYAVDFDGDGKIDLHGSPVDAIGSIAHFLAEHRWKRNHPTVFPAVLEPDCAISPDSFLNQGLVAKFTEKELKTACISGRESLPKKTLFGVIDLPNGTDETEYFLGTNNFFAITHYNRSYFYAMSVISLGNAVRANR